MGRILVVEDNNDIRESIVALLCDEGYEVLEAENGAEGLRLLDSGDIDLVVLDLMMPVMNGATFRWKQRWESSSTDVPVLVLTSVQDGRKSAEVLDANGYLPKPFSPEDFLAEVAWLRRSCARSGSRHKDERRLPAGGERP
jgi:DNA-binding response OmpR family regulator